MSISQTPEHLFNLMLFQELHPEVKRIVPVIKSFSFGAPGIIADSDASTLAYLFLLLIRSKRHEIDKRAKKLLLKERNLLSQLEKIASEFCGYHGELRRLELSTLVFLNQEALEELGPGSKKEAVEYSISSVKRIFYFKWTPADRGPNPEWLPHKNILFVIDQCLQELGLSDETGKFRAQLILDMWLKTTSGTEITDGEEYEKEVENVRTTILHHDEPTHISPRKY